MFYWFIWVPVNFSRSQTPQEIQLKAQMSLYTSQIYNLEKKVDKLQVKNKSMNELVKYYKEKEKQRKLKSFQASDETKKVCMVFAFNSILNYFYS